MSKLAEFREHFNGVVEGIALLPNEGFECFFEKRRGSERCVTVYPQTIGHRIELSYYVGVDWIKQNEQAIFVRPKLDQSGSGYTDYLGMLFSALKHPEVITQTTELFVIKFDDPYIEIKQHQDLLTPLLAVQFLRVVQMIVRKGLKRSYYRVERNLAAKIKGKVLVAATTKHNVMRANLLHTYCSYEEFGLNGLENRMLMKALCFVQRYLSSMPGLGISGSLVDVFNFIMPAFAEVSDDVQMSDMRQQPINPLFKEYAEGLRLAKLLLKRFGYNITNARSEKLVSTPPFWIDMSKLFELYVLGLLKDVYHNAVSFQEKGNYGWLDFLLNTADQRVIIDAKYKPQYVDKYDIDDIRQLSGYARDRRVLTKLNYPRDAWKATVPECLIIYPTSNSKTGQLGLPLTPISMGRKEAIIQFEMFFKLSVALPSVQLPNRVGIAR